MVVPARLHGPLGYRVLHLALDTGATTTLVRSAVLVSLGYDPASSSDRVQMTMGSGVEYVPRLRVSRLEALGQDRIDFAIVAHTLPPSATVDGLLGLDFLRGHRLVVDLRGGSVDLR